MAAFHSRRQLDLGNSWQAALALAAGIHPDPDTYLAVGDMLAGSYRQRAKFTVTAGVVIVLAAAYGHYVLRVHRTQDPSP